MDDRYHAVRCTSLISWTQAAAALGEIGFQGNWPIRAQVQGLVVLAIIVVADVSAPSTPSSRRWHPPMEQALHGPEPFVLFAGPASSSPSPCAASRQGLESFVRVTRCSGSTRLPGVESCVGSTLANTVPRAVYARSTPTSHGTTNFALGRSIVVALPCMSTLPMIRGCRSDGYVRDPVGPHGNDGWTTRQEDASARVTR